PRVTRLSRWSTPLFLTCDELPRLAHVLGACGFVTGHQADPLSHRPALAGVEHATLAACDQLGDPLGRQLHHEHASRREGEEFAGSRVPEPGRRQHLAPLDSTKALRGTVEDLLNVSTRHGGAPRLALD